MTIRTKPPKPKPVAVQQFTLIQKIGFRDRVKCWCGSLCIKGSPDFQQWKRQHSECEPKQEES